MDSQTSTSLTGWEEINERRIREQAMRECRGLLCDIATGKPIMWADTREPINLGKKPQWLQKY